MVHCDKLVLLQLSDTYSSNKMADYLPLNDCLDKGNNKITVQCQKQTYVKTSEPFRNVKQAIVEIIALRESV